ncbi:MAG: S-layer homology domain-containing protein [Clostridia bacterium]|nr:S-layer homology domain-containing protein [Clostridia bacterium]
MMNKRITAICLLCVLLLGCIGLSAGAEEAKENLLRNGDMEKVSTNGHPLIWTEVEEIKSTTEYHRSGNYAMKIEKEYTQQSVYGIIPGEEYQLEVWYLAAGGVPRIKGSWWIDHEDGTRDAAGGDYLPVAENSGRPQGKWTKFSYTLTAPENVTRLTIMLRFALGEAVAIVDDVSVTGHTEGAGDAALSEDQIFPTVEDTGEIIENGSFEKLTDGKPEGAWGAYKKNFVGNEYVSIENFGHTGDKSARLTAAKTGTNPWINYAIPVEEGARYQVTLWIFTEIKSGYYSMKLEFYNSEECTAETSVGYSQSWQHKKSGGRWKQVSVEFIAPATTKTTKIYPRLYGAGYVYIDDVSCRQIVEQPIFDMDTDQVFYYSDYKPKGVATLTKKYYSGEEIGDAKFYFLDGETVLAEETMPFAGESVEFQYSMKLFEEKQKEYTIRAEVLKPDGTVYRQYNQPVYKYDRPSNINEKGEIIVDGEVFHPIFSYHHPEANFEEAKEMGVNTIQQYALEYLGKEYLDYCHEHGLKVLVMMYADMRPPAHPEVKQARLDKLAYCKGHPAVLGYALMDEPYYNINDPEDLLRESYKMLRDYDMEKPVFMVDEASENQDIIGKYCDIVAVDPYIASRGKDAVGTQPTYGVSLADKGGDYNKPVFSLLQAFDFQEYWPTDMELKNMVYQNFLAGAYSTGYFAFDRAKDGKPLDETEIWDIIVEMGEKDIPELFDVFVDHAYPVVFEQRTDVAWIYGYFKEGNIHIICLNKTQKDQVVSIPLVSFDEKVHVNGFTAQIHREKTTSVTEEGDTLTVSMGPVEVVNCVVTPKEAIDESLLTTMRFVDLYDYAWARNQIEMLAAKELVNYPTYKSFQPGRNITRGEFALFLVRTLGLEGETAENFVDVEPDAEYAKELAIGRAAGILNGIGDNKYNPEAEITRQDMMTIIARGMKLLETEADLTGFSDTGLIADYALEGVRAMVGTGLVKGNADGTLNPLGNTTRAEAAVIMSRILAQ